MIASRHPDDSQGPPALSVETETISSAEQNLLARAFRGSALRLGFVEIGAEGLVHRTGSAACADLLGVPRDRLRDVPVADLGLPDDLIGLWHEACLDAWRSERSVSFHYIDQTTEPPRRLAFIVTPLADGEDDSRHLCTYQVEEVRVMPWAAAPTATPDTTGQHGTEIPASAASDADRHAREEHFRHVVETTPAFVWTSDPDGDRDHFNRSWLAFTGRRMEEELGQGWTTGVHPDDLDAYLETFLDALQARESFRVEYRLRRHDGAWRNLVDQGVPRFRSDGAFLGYVGSSTDITDRRTAERRLEWSGRWYRELVEGIDNLVIRLDAEHRIAFVNAVSRRLLGAEPEECVGFPFLDFVHPGDREAVRELLVEHRAGSDLAGSPVEARLRGRQGQEHDLFWTVAIRQDAEGKPGLDLIGQDVSERKRGEQMRRRLDRRLRQAQKLESLGVLAGGIAHDFNNLLMVILGNASLALQDLGGHSVRCDIEQIETAALRASELTKQMLAYSGKGQFVVEPASLSVVVEEMKHLLDTSVAPDVAVDYRLAAELPEVSCDVSQIRQVVISLVANASEAIETKGTVRVTTGVRECRRADLDETFLADELPEGRYVYLEVVDDGVGMDDETRARIFDPFFTTKFTGRGLGLAAVLGIVRGHSGGIRVETRPGEGSTFTVLLPAQATRDAAARPAVAAEPDLVEATVLVVDDEDDVRDLSSRLLERLGYRVLAASTGEEAIALYRVHGEGIALVLLDMTMPGLDGEETFRRLREQDPDVRVVLSSGYSEQIASERFDRDLAEHIAGFLQKPYRQADLAHKLEAVLPS